MICYNFVLLLSLATPVLGLTSYDHFNVVDAKVAIQVNSFVCLFQSNDTDFQVFAARGYSTKGLPDKIGLGNLQNAQAAKFQVDVIIEPCATCAASGAAQAQTLLNSLSSMNINVRLAWIDFQQTTWSADIQRNRQIVSDMGRMFDSQKVTNGVRAAADQWNVAVGSDWTAISAQKKPLWWPRGSGATEITPRAYVAFGGWSTPTLHQFEAQMDRDCSGVGMYHYNIGFQ